VVTVSVNGAVVSGLLASAAAGFAIALAFELFRRRLTGWEPGVGSRPGLSPEFADAFASASGSDHEVWVPSASAQRWLVERRHLILRIRSEGRRVGIALLPTRGSVPGYPRPLDRQMLDQILALVSEVPAVVGRGEVLRQ
jgi:hypothetical protein